MRELTYTEALREALAEEMARDKRVFMMGEDIGAYGGAFGVTRGLLDKFGAGRVIDTPISEPGFVGAAIGAALTGCRPVVEIMFMDFITLAVDQLVNQAAKLRYVLGSQAKCPIVIRSPSGGGRCYGPTHSQSLERLFFGIPGIKIAAPSTPADAKGLLKTAVRDNNPVVFIEHKMLYGTRGNVAVNAPPLPFGKARIVREGSDVTIVAWSWMAAEAAIAAEVLASRGISAEVIDIRTLNPLDIKTISASAKKTARIIIVEEAPKTGGISAEIGMQVIENVYEYLDAPVKRVAGLDVPLSASPSLESAAIPGREQIISAAVELLK